MTMLNILALILCNSNVDVVGVSYNLQNQVSKFTYTIHNILVLSTLVGLDKLEYVLLLKGQKVTKLLIDSNDFRLDP